MSTGVFSNKKCIVILATMVLSLSCQTTTRKRSSPIRAENWKQLGGRVFSQQLPIEEFAHKGPFKICSYKQLTLPISPRESYEADYYRPKHAGKAPLVIFVHGNMFNRHVHSKQARRLASWGFHSLVVDVPNHNEWVENGTRVAKITKLIHSYPQVLSSLVDTNRILLVGHSFGGSAVTLAAAHDAPVQGLILLDPAVVHNRVIKAMQHVNVPVVLLGADPKVFKSRKRGLFFKNIPTPMTEVTIMGSTHNDAQYPSINSWRWGIDPFTTHSYQEKFLTSIIASAFGLSQKNLRYIWTTIRHAEKEEQGFTNTKIRFTKNIEPTPKPRESSIDSQG